MHLIVRRYSRSGAATTWFYALLCTGFFTMAIWGFVRQDWLAAMIALAMAPVTLAGGRAIQRVQQRAKTARGKDNLS